MKKLLLTFSLILASSQVVFADTFDLSCEFDGSRSLAVIDTKLSEQNVFGGTATEVNLTDTRVVLISDKHEQFIVDRLTDEVYFNGEILPNATCEVLNLATADLSRTGSQDDIASSDIEVLKSRLSYVEEELEQLKSNHEGLVLILSNMASSHVLHYQEIVKNFDEIIDEESVDLTQ